MINNGIELLAPAGSYDSMKAAYNAGADAVYIGGQLFGARAYADNLDTDRMIDAIHYAHIHGKRLYLTINTLLKEREIEQRLYEYIKPFYEAGLDAVIVQDMGVFEYIKTNFGDLPIHASTQMMITGAGSAALLEKMGASRIVTARELSLEEIKNIHDSCNIEIESFIHGALCYCYSGQCLFSSLIGGRSGNRGRCAQPCRLPYDVMQNKEVLNPGNKKYILSPKDMCTLEILPQIIEAGVCSLKIEGRMKKPEYTAGVVSIYRKYLDYYLRFGAKEYKVNRKDLDDLNDIFNRNGFNQGYYLQQNGKNMITFSETKFREQNNSLMEDIRERYIVKDRKEKINVILKISKDLPAKMTVEYNELSVTVEGAVVKESFNQPLTKEIFEKQIKKMGNTAFEPVSIETHLENQVFMTIRDINHLRRNAILALEETILNRYRRVSHCNNSVLYKVEDENTVLKINCLVSDIAQLKILEDFAEIDSIYIDSDCFRAGFNAELKSLIHRLHRMDKSIFYVFPYIFRRKDQNEFSRVKKQLDSFEIDGYVIRNLETYAYLKSCTDKLLIFDYNMYAYTSYAKERYNKFGCIYQVLPLELNYWEMKERGCKNDELVVYGYAPMMITANCLRKNTEGCSKEKGMLKLKDRYHNVFNVKTECSCCYNIIYNNKPLSLLDYSDDIEKLGLRSIRLDFSFETPNEVRMITEKYLKKFIYRQNVKEISDFTRGHFKRGVE